MSSKGKILIVDDQQAVGTALSMLLELHDYLTEYVSSPEQALVVLAQGGYMAVLQDMNFREGMTSGQEGVRLFRQIRAAHTNLPVLLMTAWGSLETAVTLVKEGAVDYLEKPWNDTKLIEKLDGLVIAAATSRRRAKAQGKPEFVYVSEAMREVVELAEKVAPAQVPILISGPNGSGKEMLADHVVRHSSRKDKPFIKVNMGALPAELMEAELFGAEAGAFTGARQMRLGRFEAADGGTLFLDEIGNLSLAGQMKLLRVLQSGEFQRLGSTRTRKTDVRILSATNADLPQAIRDGAFREDLYFRLNVMELKVPGLSERAEDIVPLSREFLRIHAPDLSLSDEACASLSRHQWPGNVRQLHNHLQRAVLLCGPGPILPEHLRLDSAGQKPAEKDSSLSPEALELLQLIREMGGNISKSAEALGISRQALYRRMARLGIRVERSARG